MENYICINGKKAELTEEQMKALGIEMPKTSLFTRAVKYNTYYAIDTGGVVRECKERNDGCDDKFYNIANYCTDKAILEQRALHETINRLLWRYSMEHDGDKIDFTNGNQSKYVIIFNKQTKSFELNQLWCLIIIGAPYFLTRETAEAAIKEIIEPFMKAHPEFKW